MVIASIDLMDGKAVQLVEGKEKKLERENPVQLAREFDRFGEIAVIDLDAAMGKGNNLQVIGEICAVSDCRVGGGIRTVQQAREIISLGAQRVIIGSKAFLPGVRADSNSGVQTDYSINIPFLEELAKAIGRQRIIVAVDARNREIVVDGWRTATGLDLVETAKQLELYVSELLFTCVEKEGHMQGTDMEAVCLLRENFKKPLTAAGGVTTLEEVRDLAEISVDAQLGMALYTGRISLEDAFICSLNRSAATAGLVPVVTTDEEGRVLMMAYTNETALQKAFETGKMCYYSRSRQELWLKGETSGHFQQLVRLRLDCDRDSILAMVNQTGAACHLDRYSCFGDKEFSLQDLYQVIEGRFLNPLPGSYTASLDNTLVREKLMEEAQEVVEAKEKQDVIWEAADLLYFLTVLLQKERVSINEVLRELSRRRSK